MKAIPTKYAGCYFRSRLEARWAVFFDTLDIRWEYEFDNRLVTWRLSLQVAPPFVYLPDFWLPDLGMWAEVKGAFSTTPDFVRFLNAAAALSSNGGGGCHDVGGNDVLFLPGMPRLYASSLRLPYLSLYPPISYTDTYAETRFTPPRILHMHKGSLRAIIWDPGKQTPPCDGGREIAADFGGFDEIFAESEFGTDAGSALDAFMGGRDITTNTVSAEFCNAVDAARSARFEHGQYGAKWSW